MTHLLLRSSDRRALCGQKDPLPVVLAAYAPAHSHIDDWCGDCLARAELPDLARGQGAMF